MFALDTEGRRRDGSSEYTSLAWLRNPEAATDSLICVLVRPTNSVWVMTLYEEGVGRPSTMLHWSPAEEKLFSPNAGVVAVDLQADPGLTGPAASFRLDRVFSWFIGHAGPGGCAYNFYKLKVWHDPSRTADYLRFGDDVGQPSWDAREHGYASLDLSLIHI